jgi:hypothetical protein
MNPYDKYLSINYGDYSEEKIMKILDDILDIDAEIYGEETLARVSINIALASTRLKYKKVINRLQKIFPLMIRGINLLHAPNPEIESISNIAPPMPVHFMTNEERKLLDEMNAFLQSIKNKNKRKQ